MMGPKGMPGMKGMRGHDVRDPGTVGSTYVIWGNDECPGTASMVYAGKCKYDYYDMIKSIQCCLTVLSE